MGIWSALGQGLEDYAVKRLQNRHSQQHNGLGQTLMNAVHPPDPNPYNPQLDRQVATAPGGQQQAPLPDQDRSMESGPDLSMSGTDSDSGGLDMLGAGKMVTHPTLAMVGEKGPEAVVPLTDQPGAKVTPGLLGGMPHTRWGHPTGPGAAKRMSPIRGALPIKPNPSLR